MKEYHLHKNDYANLQLEIHKARPYCKKNVNHCFSPHRHSFYQIIWFKREGKHYVDYNEYVHPTDAVFTLSAGQVHHFDGQSANEGYLIHFNDIFLLKADKDKSRRIQFRLFDEFGNPQAHIPDNLKPDFQFTVDKMMTELEEKKANYKEALYHHLQILLLSIDRIKSYSGSDLSYDPHLEIALQYRELIKSNGYEFRNVAYYSRKLGVSEKTLSTITKKYYRESPANYIHNKRILEAKRLLSNSNLSIKEISYQLGFKQATYFTQVSALKI